MQMYLRSVLYLSIFVTFNPLHLKDKDNRVALICGYFFRENMNFSLISLLVVINISLIKCIIIQGLLNA